MWKIGVQFANGTSHIANNKVAVTFRVIRVAAIKGNTVAMNLSTAINTRLKMDTICDTSLKYDLTSDTEVPLRSFRPGVDFL